MDFASARRAWSLTALCFVSSQQLIGVIVLPPSLAGFLFAIVAKRESAWGPIYMFEMGKISDGALAKFVRMQSAIRRK
jgi:hypothetical protein